MDLEWSIGAQPNGPRTGPDRRGGASLSLSCFLIYPNKALGGDSQFARPLFAFRSVPPRRNRRGETASALAFANRENTFEIIIHAEEDTRGETAREEMHT